MADSMCGPSNAMKGLAQHLDRDRALHQDRVTSANSSSVDGIQQGFRSLGLGFNAANQQFSAFQGGHASLNTHQPGPSLPLASAPYAAQGPHYSQVPSFYKPGIPTAATEGQNWAADFHQMNLGGPASQIQPGVGGPGVVHPFASGVRTAGPFMPSQMHLAPRNPIYTPPSFASPQAQVDISAVHQAAQLPLDFNSDFDFEAEMRAWMSINGSAAEAAETDAQSERYAEAEVEALRVATAELAEQDLAEQDAALAAEEAEEALAAAEEQAAVRDEPDDSELALAAQQILDSVADNQTDKFKNSTFVQMMRNIAERKLVVRDNALVDSAPAPTSSGDGFAAAGHASAKLAHVEDAESP
ncbi:hypothetical protein GGS23DRAFT_367790 [Durotheca rogersii]|uniref:uncharacterized protein n=1 Tax=Durotheca rogersii TaxID=419775 RepID=UPI00221E480A|nr:uncharacterized protein GGS23DRAFT_367790 [Durotheca rogersii]KAI5866088.1 hypothetical protein GGS23DRAFT_367790 [Durotheca rogersii]